MKARTAPKRARPNCTHIIMERIYTRDDYCLVCERRPPLGFLYECRQDCIPASDTPSSYFGHDRTDSVMKSDLRRNLEEIGLSDSVISIAESGGYTVEQLEKLKMQKLELKQVISDTVQQMQLSYLAARLALAAEQPPNNDGALDSVSASEVFYPPCSFRACHACRPYYKDRIYISIPAVLSNHFNPILEQDATHLPVKSARIMREFSILPKPRASLVTDTTSPSTLPTSHSLNPDGTPESSHSSVLTFKTTQTDMDDLSQTHCRRRRFYKMGHRSSGDIARDLSRLPRFARQGLKSAFQGIFRPSRESSSEGSNITLPMPRTGTARDAPARGPSVRDFDMGALRRVRRQKERNDLRHGMCLGGGFEGLAAPSRLHGTYSLDVAGHNDEEDQSSSGSTDSIYSVYSCASEGSEVEVSGGVALTEEAVETHVPDILSAPVAGPQYGARLHEEQSLQSIMAQV